MNTKAYPILTLTPVIAPSIWYSRDVWNVPNGLYYDIKSLEMYFVSNSRYVQSVGYLPSNAMEVQDELEI
jgi:hypothetical protein